MELNNEINMNNKTLALVAGIPIWSAFSIGVIEGITGEVFVSDGVYAVIGMIMIVAVLWASYRLSKIKDKKGTAVTNKVLAGSAAGFIVASLILPDGTETFTYLFAIGEMIAVTMLAIRLYAMKD